MLESVRQLPLDMTCPEQPAPIAATARIDGQDKRIARTTHASTSASEKQRCDVSLEQVVGDAWPRAFGGGVERARELGAHLGGHLERDVHQLPHAGVEVGARWVV